MREEDSQSIPSTASDCNSSMGKPKGEREGWKGTLDFLLTCIGFAVGLGNIWRFPYLCYKSGGGAFFIPYFTFLVLCGIPLFMMESIVGQFASLSPIALWRVCPLFKGVGIGMVIVSAMVCVYYNVIIAYTLYYLFMSLRAVLPWSTCGNWWNTDTCVDTDGSVAMPDAGNSSIFGNENLNVSAAALNLSAVAANVSSAMYNISGNVSAVGKTVYTSSSEEFWERHVLQITSGIEEPGSLRLELLVCLIVAWLCVFFCLFKGVAVLGKVMHFCAPFPYLVLLVLLIRGLTLEGAMEGVKFYIIPRWEKLATFQVWGDAALQIFYSVGMGWGGIITMASYNGFKHNIYKDALIVPFINCGTSIFAGFVIFSILGFMAHETGQTVEEVVKQGPGLTFVAYPQAVAMLPISPLWALLFFLMLFIIGLDSQFGMFETCLSAFMDEFPHVLRKRRVTVAAVACFVEFLLGLPLITQGGIYVLQIIDWYCASFSLMLISLTECLAISWIYGVDRFYKDLELMIGFKPSRYWSYMWRFFTPITILFIWVFSVATLGPVTYGTVTYPSWAVALGWTMGMLSILPIPGCAIYQILKEKEGTLIEKIKKLCKPTEKWGPKNEENMEEYRMSLKSHNHIVLNGSSELTHRHPDRVVEQERFLP